MGNLPPALGTVSAPRSVCVIGAQGTLGNAVVKRFASAGWTVFPAGRRDDPREDFRKLDLDRPETVGAALRDVDLVVSAVADPKLTAERWVLEQGGLLVNCSHAPARAARRGRLP
jgi:NAD(P)-dependent dehydrogenase (short-subunit alcohol dehydrogenase family)